MFILLSQLIAKGNFSGMHLMIRPIKEGQIEVVLCTERNDFRCDDPAIQAALAQPLRVAGAVTDIEAAFKENLSSFCDSALALTEHSNLAKVTDSHAKAKAAASETAKPQKTVTDSVTEPPSPSDDAISETDPDLF